MTRKQQAYFNFINSLNSSATKKRYAYRLGQFLNYCKLDLPSFLKLPDQKITHLTKETFNIFQECNTSRN